MKTKHHDRVRRASRFVATRLWIVAALTLVTTGLVAAVDSGSPARFSAGAVELSDTALARGAVAHTELPVDAEMVGFNWRGPVGSVLSMRTLNGSTSSTWQTIEDDMSDPDATASEFRDLRHAGPIWVGHNASAIDVRVVSGDVSGLKVTAIDTEPARAPSGVNIQVAGAVTPRPAIASRTDWGADESWRNSQAGCAGYPHYASNVGFAVVHHTANSNDYTPDDVPALLRGIYYFHVFSNGWCDIGYNFLVDKFGGVWEGRYGGINRPVIGGHTSGFNTGSVGISVIGNFDVANVPGAALSGLESILAYKLSYHRVDPMGKQTVTVGANVGGKWPEGTRVTIDNLTSHGDLNFTDCPGQFLHDRLDQIRRNVTTLVTLGRQQHFTCTWRPGFPDAPVVFSRGQWSTRFTPTGGSAHLTFPYGDAGDIAVCGDWNDDGQATPGVFRNGQFFLRNSISAGVADVVIGFGDPGDQPVVGDWNGDGRTDIGVVRAGTWYLRTITSLVRSNLVADASFAFGDPSDEPVVGQWRRGPSRPAVFRDGIWYARDSLTSGFADAVWAFGDSGDEPFAGDWNADGIDGPGISRSPAWFLRNTNTNGPVDVTFAF